jgi:hypothetical protein
MGALVERRHPDSTVEPGVGKGSSTQTLVPPVPGLLPCQLLVSYKDYLLQFFCIWQK